MNEEQAAQLAGLLQVAIEDINSDVRSLRRMLLELKLLKAKSLRNSSFCGENKKLEIFLPKSALERFDDIAEFVQKYPEKTDTASQYGFSVKINDLINSKTTSFGENKELDGAELMAMDALFKLSQGDLLGAVSLTFKAQRVVSAEASRLTTAALGKKAAKHKKTQDAKYERNRKAKEAVLAHWNQMQSIPKSERKKGFENKRKAGDTYAAMLYRGELIGGNGFSISAQTISEDWL